MIVSLDNQNINSEYLLITYCIFQNLQFFNDEMRLTEINIIKQDGNLEVIFDHALKDKTIKP